MRATLARLGRWAHVFGRENRGVSAVEFALILPIMLLLYAGSVELSEALAVDRKVNRVASTLGDLVAQKETLTASELTDIFAAATSIIEPYTANTLKTVVMAVDIKSGKQTIAWVKTSDGSTPPTTPIPVPANIAVDGTQVIVAQTTYQFTSPFSSFMKGITGKTSYDLSHVFMMRPRIGNTVTYTP
ncbi:TadE/TadG family type IV pilus assembly protein [Chthonobacter albigriseus]|uniref:TadE/TadG family type IV pilus assembly protein n=1 Tax=Chthonobacter albigriseus TaxID=1683161 RepID=UPI0015EF3A38|nr:TadE/TadG family type IV pilus assembly protein [Chthonobacter albigriseus]